MRNFSTTRWCHLKILTVPSSYLGQIKGITLGIITLGITCFTEVIGPYPASALALEFLVIALYAKLYPKTAQIFFRVFNKNQETERSVLITIMVIKIEKKIFRKIGRKKFLARKIFFSRLPF